MRLRSNVGMMLAICAVAAVRLPSQAIRGRLVDGLSHAPVAGALAELRDMQGELVQQTFASPTGVFVFAAALNRQYQLRLAAIGYARHATINITVGAEPVVLPDIALTAIAVTLPALNAMSSKKACGKSEITPETFGGLLESAHTSLEMMDATLKSAQFGFQTVTIERKVVRLDHDSSRTADTTVGVLHDWPVRSLPVDSLRLIGFQRPNTPEEGSGHHYYGPDMETLFSDWFLDTHCFALDKGRSKGDTVIIKFDPANKPKNVDISGELILDRASLTMRRLNYVLRNLPDGLPDRAAGGEMQFAEKSEGFWVPVEWAIWAPISKAQRSISRPSITMAPGQRGSGGMPRLGPPPPEVSVFVQVVGRKEQRGRLTRIIPLGGG